MKVDLSGFEVRLAETDEEIVSAQRLRYRVFVEEMGATATPQERAQRREHDRFDPYFDHLILIDRHWNGDPLDKVVGVYRLLRSSVAQKTCGFYSVAEYDLSLLTNTDFESVELGRSCVAVAHRGGAAMLLLWYGLADYVVARKIQIMFGVASFHGTDPEEFSEALTVLYNNHLAPPELRVKAVPEHYVEMNRMPLEKIDPLRAMRTTPPLIKSYIRLGGFVGDGAFIDHDFNTVDVCLIMDTARMSARYRNFYTRGAA